MSTTRSTPTTLTTSLTTPAARLAQRDNVYLGYYISGTSTSTQYCGPGEVFTTSNTWAGCYQSTEVASPTTLYTGCTSISDPSVYIAGLATCTTQSCFTQTVYQTYPNVSAMTNFYCAPTGWPATVVYRNIPLEDSSTTSASSLTSTPSIPSSTSTSTSSPSTTTTAISSSSPSSPNSSSKAWIAGPVLGSLALIAFICFGLWYILNRRGRRRAESSQSPHNNPEQLYLPETKAELPNDYVKSGGGATQAQVQGQNENVYYEIDQRQMGGAELPSNRPVGAGRVELSS